MIHKTSLDISKCVLLHFMVRFWFRGNDYVDLILLTHDSEEMSYHFCISNIHIRLVHVFVLQVPVQRFR